MKIEAIQEDLYSIRISIRAMHGAVATAVKNVLCLYLLTR